MIERFENGDYSNYFTQIQQKLQGCHQVPADRQQKDLNI